ncbi:putative NAD(P)-binding-domain-containing protein [Fusarium sp. MPI-SDFR-AT-0072]|uniref:precorrin-2 dehydrogenase n=1 Tax=Fusarium oxysporum f. sp. rapae TaxID=485398 RepID=A0A8J5TRZ2_FUSOX|nr:Siroheme biosynthesis protein met8 [Fusarium oxysporum f. sp. rapae]KAH7158750.1 putative NAD(P)-binding-domain-containing protein [Fusarium sp. MPI-SDFR-AT-0072]
MTPIQKPVSAQPALASPASPPASSTPSSESSSASASASASSSSASIAMAKTYPPVQPGGSLILAWQIKHKKVLVVGGGEVAAGRILNCLNADANVTVVCPKSGLNDEVAYRISEGQVAHVDRVFEPEDLDGASMVLVAIDDPAASTVIWKLCKERRIPANIADVPPECDFYFGSIHRDGPLQIMVSTNGKGPRLAAAIRQFIAKQLPKNAGNAIETIGELRLRLRKMAPKPEDGPKRMLWMSKVSDTYKWDEMCGLTDEDMDNLLLFYPANKVPAMDVLLALRGGTDVKKLDVFDGSFGFSVGA